MRRRTFAQAVTAGAALALPGCGTPIGQLWLRLFPKPGPALGTNLSGLEWAQPGLRYGPGTAPNLNFTAPRKAEVAWLASHGYTRNRLPIQWEMLQPMLHDSPADARARALIGQPGELHAGYAAYITDVLDAHAAAGTKVILDCHNYCRYRDFRFQPDGSVKGLKRPPDPLLRAYTGDNTQVQERIFSLAPQATLRVGHFTDFWTRVVHRWKGHPGVGGWGLMNEPHDLPRPGESVASSGGGQDLTIWPTFAQAAVNAIREIDGATPIYVAGNDWSSPLGLASRTPGFPLAGANLVYEVHLYLDALSNGKAFDYDTEAGRRVGGLLGPRPLHPDTGVERLRPAVAWAGARGLKLALTEVGMPIDDPRWQEMFTRLVDYGWRSGIEMCSWMGGSHWAIRNYAINHTPGWHQRKTVEPAVSGCLKAPLGVSRAALFDEGPGWLPAGTTATFTLRARGFLAAPLTVEVAAQGGGSFSKAVLTIPAGANGSDSFSFTPASAGVALLTYSSPGGHQVPPARKVYSLADPVAHAAVQLSDAAHAVLARYGASKWEMADGHTDFVQGGPASDGQQLRAVCDSGFGSTVGNAMEMLNWVNRDNALSGTMKVPVMRTVHGRKASDHTAPDTFGLWCKKTAPQPGIQPRPVNRVPYDLHEPHFAIAAISVPGTGHHGVVFQASRAEANQAAEIALAGNVPQARWRDADGQEVVLTAGSPLTPHLPAVIALTCEPGAQALRVNSAQAGRASARLAPSVFAQFLIGWGFLNHYPRAGFGGHVFSVVTGRGVPTPEELAVLERYLAGTAGLDPRSWPRGGG
jgi:hypothetical protein